MAKVRDYHKLALDIIDVVGGQKNIVNATRCATRLRLVLKETPEGAKEKVSALAGVITVVENNGQFQVVIGTHVGEVYDSVAEALHLDASAQEIEHTGGRTVGSSGISFLYQLQQRMGMELCSRIYDGSNGVYRIYLLPGSDPEILEK